jgi:hypothetical protein
VIEAKVQWIQRGAIVSICVIIATDIPRWSVDIGAMIKQIRSNI